MVAQAWWVYKFRGRTPHLTQDGEKTLCGYSCKYGRRATSDGRAPSGLCLKCERFSEVMDVAPLPLLRDLDK